MERVAAPPRRDGVAIAARPSAGRAVWPPGRAARCQAVVGSRMADRAGRLATMGPDRLSRRGSAIPTPSSLRQPMPALPYKRARQARPSAGRRPAGSRHRRARVRRAPRSRGRGAVRPAPPCRRRPAAPHRPLRPRAPAPHRRRAARDHPSPGRCARSHRGASTAAGLPPPRRAGPAIRPVRRAAAPAPSPAARVRLAGRGHPRSCRSAPHPSGHPAPGPRRQAGASRYRGVAPPGTARHRRPLPPPLPRAAAAGSHLNRLAFPIPEPRAASQPVGALGTPRPLLDRNYT